MIGTQMNTDFQDLYITSQLIAHAGRGGFKTRPYRRTLTGIFAIYMRIL
jgi:hypothetical protein